MAITFQHKRGTAAKWASTNPILLAGEPGYETDTGKFKIGNGVDNWNTLSYSSGVKGDKGDRGDVGPQGIQGEVGPRGPQGLQGVQGERGLQGEQGIQGLTGSQGIQGEKGDKGDTGSQGIQGIQGTTGAQGVKGDDGYTPIKGLDYFDGVKGDKGDTGSQGIQGIQGDTGAQGIQGPKGDTGDRGYTPIKGVDYFDGAKGDRGDKGDTGDQGIQGIQGIQGVQGEQGPQGIPGTGIGIAINVQALTSSPTDAQTVYFGMLPKAPTTTANISKIYIRQTCTLKRAEIYTYAGTAGTAESWSLYVRKNNTTDYLIATLTAATNERVFSNTGLSVSLVTGDYLEIKSVQPTWATNPLTLIYGGYLYFE